MFISRTSSSVSSLPPIEGYLLTRFSVTATGKEQAPVHNLIGAAIVDACVKAGKEGRKFRVILVIPAIPGFAGDLREDAAKGTRAIMDYQYKSINRGEHSIKERIRAQGVDPDNHIFVFNLRSYDRLNTTPQMKEQEEKSGVKYQEVQRAQAEEIMGAGIHGDEGSPEDKNPGQADNGPDNSGNTKSQSIVDQKRKFEAQREAVGLQDGQNNQKQVSADSIAKDAMLGQNKVSEESWAPNAPELEWENFIQEELYIHAKVMIVDDKIAICGSSNINDRSQLGFHDSELSIVMEDTATIESTMDGQPYTAGKHAATLRRLLWREHLGLLPPEDLDGSNDPNCQPPGDSPNENFEGKEYEFVADPLSDKVWDLWTSQATTNTDIFRDLFHADPDNSSKFLSYLSHSSANRRLIFSQFVHSKTITFSRQIQRKTRSISKVICTTKSYQSKRSKSNSIVSGAILYGCRLISSVTLRWRNGVCR
jgi:phospholipase D1/2